MCLTIYEKTHPGLKPKVAESDIRCFKVIRWMDPDFLARKNGATSVPTGVYESNYVYCRTNEITEFPEQSDAAKRVGLGHLSWGFHTFKKFPDAVSELDFWLKCNGRNDTKHFDIAECCIPAGTEYYEGYTDSMKEGYASKTLVIEDFEEGKGYYKYSQDIEKRYK